MATSYTFQPPYVADVKLEVGTWNVPKSRHKCLEGLWLFLIQLFQSIKQGKWTPRKKKSSGKLENGVHKTIGLEAYFQVNRQGEGVQVGGAVQAN